MSTYRPSRPRRSLLSFLLFATLLVSLAMPALAQEGAPPDQAGSGQPASCAPLNEAEQQEFDNLTAMKAADALAGADLARYDALAQQINCYNAQFAAPAQPEQTRGAPALAAPLAPGVCDTAGPIEVEGSILGTTPTAYATLAAAFTAINNGVHTGAITIDVCGDTSEGTATAALNASGSGSASYTSLTVAPAGGAARTISGATTAGNPLINLNGADNVTINGLNSGGNALTLSNTTASATANTSTIRFINGATNNTITNATILGSFSAAVTTDGGNIYFATDANTANGNDNNTISNNNIGPAGANLPTKGVYSFGTTTTAALFNSGNVITGNNIFDYFGAAVTSAGVYLASGTTDFTISNNKFYQTATRTQTTGGQHSAIWIEGTSGNNHQITGNTIGFASSAGTGTYTFVGVSSSSVLVPIYLNVGTTTATSVQGNTIAGIAMSGAVSGTSSSAAFRGIYVSSGLTTVGDVTGNTIGSQSTTGSISYTSSSTSASDVIGIFNFGSNNWTVSNNTIGGITAANSSTGASNVYGIRVNTLSSVSFTCQNNTIGGTVANSIQSTSAAAGTTVEGVLSTSPASTITGNTIRNLTAAGGTGTTTGASVIGISVAASSANHTVRQNIIHTLSNTNASAAVTIAGIQYTASTGANLVARNLIHSFSAVSTAAILNGINVSGGTTTYQNNMIRLGIDAAGNSVTTACAINGISEPLGTDNFYFNSVYVGGSGVGTTASNTYAFNSTQTINTRSFRDNIFYNARSNTTTGGKHYAVRVGGTAPNPTGLTINNNVYLANGTGAVFGFFNSLDVANLAAWKTTVGQDANSFSSDPQYLAPTAATPDLHINASIASVIEGNGFLIASVTDDYDGQTRSTLTPVDIGADAGNFIGIDLVGPSITYTALADTTSTANRSFTNVTITDASGVNTTAGTRPRVYYKRSTDTNAWNDNTSGTNGWKWVEANGTTSPFDFTIDYSLLNGGAGVSAGTTVQYFVVAQDLAATPNVSINSGTFAAAPSSVALTAAAFPIGGTINSYLIANYIYDFEAATDEDFTHTTTFSTLPATPDDWGRGAPSGGTGAPTSAHSGTKLWGTDLTGNYENYGTYILTSPTYKATATTVAWSFWEYYSTEATYDFMYPEYSKNGGAWTAAVAGYSGAQAFWAQRTFNVTTVVNDIIQFRFRMTSDSTGVYAGWYVDDMAISGAVQVDAVPPTITYTALANTTSTSNRTLSISVTDTGSGVPTSGVGLPVLYFRKGLSGAYSSSQCTFTSGSNFDCVFNYTLVGGVTAGDTIQYYVAAQDAAATPNVAVNPATGASGLTANPPAASTPPTTPSSYVISFTYSGTYTVPGSYASLTNASGMFTALNAGVLTGNVVIEITADLTGETGAVPLNQLAESVLDATFSVTIKPTGGPRTISGTSAASSGLIILNGADNVTIDGSTSGGTDQSLTITNLNTSSAVIWIRSASASDGATGNTVKNCIINGSSSTTTIAGILSGGSTSFGSAAESPNSNNTIQNNVITKVQNAAYLLGGATNLDQNWLVTGNTFGSTVTAEKLGFRGMFIGGAQAFTISQNTIKGVTTSTTSTASGVQIGGVIAGGLISRNNISDIKNTNTTGYGSNGIYLGASSTASNLTVVNNFIFDVASYGYALTGPADNGYGIMVDAGGGYKIYDNSVRMTTNQTATTGIPAAINISSGVTAVGAVDLRGNIFANTQTVGVRYAIYSGAANTVFSNINYNDYYPGTGTLGYLGSARATLAAWQTATGQDANSISADPLFVSTTDLHISAATVSPVANAGTPIAAVVADYDAETRNAAYPDMGADEFNVSAALPGGAYTNRAVNSGETWTLGGDSTVNGTLTLNGGLVNVGTNTLTLGASATVAGTFGPTAMIIADGAGSVCKVYAAASSFTFPIGDNTAGADYSPAAINYTAGTFPGNACVRVTDAAHPNLPGGAASYTTRYWTATGTVASPTYNATFTYTAGDVVGTESSMSGKKWDGAIPWTTLGAASGNQFVGTGLTGFSDFTAFDTPLASVLADFSAAPNGNAIRVTWETVSEVGNIGFNLWRGDSPGAPDVQLNSALIPSQGPGSSQGFVYTFDDANVVSGSTYYYWVETVDTQGGVSRFGPVSATFNAPTAVRLSAFDVAPMVPFALPAAGAALLALAGWAVRRRR